MLEATRQVFVAGGIGVTPFLSMAAVLDATGGKYVLHMLSRGTPPLGDAIAMLASRGHAVVHDTRLGRPDLRVMIGPYEPGTHVYACGPAGLLLAFADATRDWPPDSVHVEHFGAPPMAGTPDAAPFKLVLARSGREAMLQGGADLLEAVEMLGAHVDASCRGGVCGACRVGWLQGPPIHRDRVLRPDERLREVALCVAGCAGPTLVLDL
jgi:ferredoxin-NADP reductase